MSDLYEGRQVLFVQLADGERIFFEPHQNAQIVEENGQMAKVPMVRWNTKYGFMTAPVASLQRLEYVA